MTQPPAARFATTRTVARNAVWNFVGRIGPIIIGLLVTPLLVRALGDDRWGVFTIILSLVGTFGIFDFGLGRALTRAVAERIGAGEGDQVSSVIVSGLCAAGILGVLGGCVIAWLSGYWVRHGMHISAQRQHEVLVSLYILCASAPLVIVNAAIWGVLAAFQRFRAVNLISIPVIAMYYVGPFLVLQVWDSLIAVMLVLVGCRLVITLTYWLVCLRSLPTLRGARPDLRHLRPLLQFGGWLTISNVMFPILLYADRFVIAFVLSAAFTGYYSTPFDLVVRFTNVTNAVMTTAFPAMTGSFRADPGNTVALFRRSVLAIAIMVFPACLVAVGFSTQLMTLWIGDDFARQAAPVLRWLALGIVFTCVDGVVIGLLDAIGRPEVNAKFSLLEFALYIPILTVLLSAFGIQGAAMAWAVRAATDFAIRLLLLRRLYRPVASAIQATACTVFVGVFLLAIPLLGVDLITRTALMAAAQFSFLGAIWCWALTPREQATVRAWSVGAIARARLPSWP